MDIVRRVKKASAIDVGAASILAEVLWVPRRGLPWTIAKAAAVTGMEIATRPLIGGSFLRLLSVAFDGSWVGVFSATMPPEALEIARKFMNKRMLFDIQRFYNVVIEELPSNVVIVKEKKQKHV